MMAAESADPFAIKTTTPTKTDITMNTICNSASAPSLPASPVESQGAVASKQPWYFVRATLLMSLASLVVLLATLLSFPELIDYVHTAAL
jgi:hypothetical protein